MTVVFCHMRFEWFMMMTTMKVTILGVSINTFWGFPGGAVVKNLSANAGTRGDTRFNPGLGRSPGGRHGNPLQYSCQNNPMDRGARWATVHAVTESNMTERLSTQMHISWQPLAMSLVFKCRATLASKFGPTPLLCYPTTTFSLPSDISFSLW